MALRGAHPCPWAAECRGATRPTCCRSPGPECREAMNRATSPDRSVDFGSAQVRQRRQRPAPLPRGLTRRVSREGEGAVSRPGWRWRLGPACMYMHSAALRALFLPQLFGSFARFRPALAAFAHIMLCRVPRAPSSFPPAFQCVSCCESFPNHAVGMPGKGCL